MTQLNLTPFTIRLRRGLSDDLFGIDYHLEGEPFYTTDSKQFYISDGTDINNVGISRTESAFAITLGEIPLTGDASFHVNTDTDVITLNYNDSGTVRKLAAYPFSEMIGSGTTGYLVKWTASGTLENSIASESGSTVSVEGDFTLHVTQAGQNRTFTVQGYNTGAGAVRLGTWSVNTSGSSVLTASNDGSFYFYSGAVQLAQFYQRVAGGSTFYVTAAAATPPLIGVSATGGGKTGALLAGGAGVHLEADSSGYFAFALNTVANFGSGSNVAMKLFGASLNAMFGTLAYDTADLGAQLAVKISGASKFGILIQMAAGQDWNPFVIEDSSGNDIFTFTKGGNITQDLSEDIIGHRIQAHSTQTSNLLEIEKSDGSDYFVVEGDGDVLIKSVGSGHNPTFTVEGYDTGASAVKSLTVKVDTDGTAKIYATAGEVIEISSPLNITKLTTITNSATGQNMLDLYDASLGAVYEFSYDVDTTSARILSYQPLVIQTESGALTLSPDTSILLDGTVIQGVDAAGYDLTLHSGTTGRSLGWDASESTLNLVGIYNQDLDEDATVGKANAFRIDSTAPFIVDYSGETGTDYTLATVYMAVRFVPAESRSAAGISLWMKTDGTITNPTATLTAYIYSHDAVNDTPDALLGTGTAMKYGVLTTSYVEIQFQISTVTALTAETTYWIVFKWSAAPTGANILIDSDTHADQGATSATGTAGTWTLTTTKPCCTVYARSPVGMRVYCDSNSAIAGYGYAGIGIYGWSRTSDGVCGTSAYGYGGRFLSTHNYGVWGQSTNGIAIFAYNPGNGYGLSAQSFEGSAGYYTQSGRPANNVTAAVIQIRKQSAGTKDNTGHIIDILDAPTTSGTVSGYTLKATIGATERIRFDPRVADGAGAVGYFVDTVASLSNATAKLFSVRNSSTEKAYIGASGSLSLQGAFGCNAATPQTSAAVNVDSTDLPTVIALCNQIRAALIADGILV